MGNAATATADQLRATWGPFLSEAGTYQIEAGNLVTIRALVAKGPQAGPVPNPTTYKLTRLE